LPSGGYNPLVGLYSSCRRVYPLANLAQNPRLPLLLILPPLPQTNGNSGNYGIENSNGTILPPPPQKRGDATPTTATTALKRLTAIDDCDDISDILRPSQYSSEVLVYELKANC
jgi:hypothetical protein